MAQFGEVRHGARAARRAVGLARGTQISGSDDRGWWDRVGDRLAALTDPDRFPHAARIGVAAGEAHQAPVAPVAAHHFGLRVILDGIQLMIDRHTDTGGRP